MEVFKVIFEKIIEVYKLDLNIFGYEFSLWSIVLWSIIGSILIYILANLLN